MTFVLLVWWHTYYSDVALRVGSYSQYWQCVQQGKVLVQSDVGSIQGDTHFRCVPVNAP